MRSFFVTGTDTGVGKTWVSSVLLHALRQRGLRAVGMKPLASGSDPSPDGWRNDDALQLLAASDPKPAYVDLNPYALPAPLAPEIAASEAGVSIELARMSQAYAHLQSMADSVVVEGVGGWAAPLAPDLDQVDLVRAFQLPVVLVVGLRLGCLNHARLTARAIADDGIKLIGWVANEVDPHMLRRDENFALLRDRIDAPCWGRLPFQENQNPAEWARHLQWD